MITKTLSAAVLSLLAGALAAQLPPGLGHKEATTGLTWPPAIGQGSSFSEIVSGRFTNYWRDAIVRKGGELGHVIGPALFDQIEALPSSATVTAVAVVPGGNPAFPNYDALVYAGTLPGSLAVVTWHPVTMVRQTTLHPAPAWVGARKLVGAAAATGYELAGIGANGQDVLRASYGALISHVSSTAVGENVRGLVLSDTNGDGELESVALTATAVKVFSRGGALLDAFPVLHAGGALVAMGNRVLAITPNAANNGYVLEFVVGGGDIDIWPEILGVTVSGAVAADLDKAEESDVVISLASSQQALAVRLGVNDDELEATVDVIDLTGTPNSPNNGSLSAVHAADFDGDGYSDWALGANTLGKILFRFGVADTIGAASPDETLLHTDTVFDNNSGPDFGTLYLRLQGDVFNYYSQVQVTLWWEEVHGAGAEPEAKSNEIYDITSFAPGDSHSLRIEAWDGYVPHEGFFHLTIVFRNEPVPGEVSYGPSFVVSGFAGIEEIDVENDTRMNHLQGVLSDGATAQAIRHPGGGGPFSPGRIIIGGLGPVPYFDPTLPPKPGSAGTGKSTVPVTPPSGG